jgi:hypothetical protein
VVVRLSVGVIAELPVGVVSDLEAESLTDTLDDTLEDSPGGRLKEALVEPSVGMTTNDVLVSDPIVELLVSPILIDDEVVAKPVLEELVLAEETKVEKEEEADSPGVADSPVESLELLSTVFETLELFTVMVCELRDEEGVVEPICPEMLVLEFVKRG